MVLHRLIFFFISLSSIFLKKHRDKNKILSRDNGLEYRNRMEDNNKILNRDNGLEYRNRMDRATTVKHFWRVF